MLSLFSRLPRRDLSLLFSERTVPLHAMPGSVGRARETETTYDWHGLRRGRSEFALFQYTLAGQGRLRVGGEEWPVGPGEAMILHFPYDNRYWLPADSRAWEFLYVCLHGREVSRLWPEIEAGLGPRVALAPDSPAVGCAARIVERAAKGGIESAPDASALAYELLMALLAAGRGARADGGGRSEIQKARRYAERNLAGDLSVDNLAREAGLSRFYFSRLFAAQTGMAPGAWVSERRVKEAARLLRGTKLPLKAIAAQCGFPDANYLGRVFRQYTGVPPATYRRSGA